MVFDEYPGLAAIAKFEPPGTAEPVHVPEPIPQVHTLEAFHAVTGLSANDMWQLLGVDQCTCIKAVTNAHAGVTELCATNQPSLLVMALLDAWQYPAAAAAVNKRWPRPKIFPLTIRGRYALQLRLAKGAYDDVIAQAPGHVQRRLTK